MYALKINKSNLNKVFGKLFQANPDGVKRMEALNKKVFGKLFHASPEGVKRMEALNKKARMDFFRADYLVEPDKHIRH